MLVKNLVHFKMLAHNKNGDFEDFYIVLAGGLARSSKRILYFPEEDEFSIIHEIDESYQELHSSKLKGETSFIEAIKAKCLYKE